VLWARRFFGELKMLQGDAGARQILKANAHAVAEVAGEGEAAMFDVDTPDMLAELRQSRESR
jgi:molybdenum cofactor cytidylyltransferase